MPHSKNYNDQFLKNGGHLGKIYLWLIFRDRMFESNDYLPYIENTCMCYIRKKSKFKQIEKRLNEKHLT